MLNAILTKEQEIAEAIERAKTESAEHLAKERARMQSERAETQKTLARELEEALDAATTQARREAERMVTDAQIATTHPLLTQENARKIARDILVKAQPA